MEMVKRLRCPQGHLVLQSHRFCSQCSNELIEIEVPGCSKCDYMWVGNDKFCPHCGRKRR